MMKTVVISIPTTVKAVTAIVMTTTIIAITLAITTAVILTVIKLTRVMVLKVVNGMPAFAMNMQLAVRLLSGVKAIKPI